jgi:hypothetical protein
MSKLECLLMACVYAALGVPLLITSLNTPEAEDLTKLKWGDLLPGTNSKILAYPTNAVIVSKVLPWQQMLCRGEELGKEVGGVIRCAENSFSNLIPSATCIPDCVKKSCKTPKDCVNCIKNCEKMPNYSQDVHNFEKCVKNIPLDSSKCKSILSQKSDSKHPWGTHDLSQEFNTLRMVSLVVSILLLVGSFVKLVEMFVTKSGKKVRGKKSRK